MTVKQLEPLEWIFLVCALIVIIIVVLFFFDVRSFWLYMLLFAGSCGVIATAYYREGGRDRKRANPDQFGRDSN
jgi:hypothetical protein